MVLFQPPDPVSAPRSRTRGAAAAATSPVEPDITEEGEAAQPAGRRPRRATRAAGAAAPLVVEVAGAEAVDTDGDTDHADTDHADGHHGEGDGTPSRRRRRGGRGRRGRGEGAEGGEATEASADGPDADVEASTSSDGSSDDHGPDEHEDGEGSRRRRRRRRRGSGEGDEASTDDPPNTVVRVRQPRGGDSNREVQGVKGSTRLEAKKQRRREGREQGRHRTSIVSEAEFLARRESVERVMVVRQKADLTQIGVLEDGVLVEHYVSNSASAGFAGNVYLGKVQNVLPGMEAAFVDIGKGRNAVLYAGEVNWDATGLEGRPRLIETALKSGQDILVQVTKDPLGHKGARLTSQVSLPGRFLVYVPNGAMTGISRKLPDTERTRLKAILKKVMPEGAGVIVRTAAEGASEEELSQDVIRLAAQWEEIQAAAKTAKAPALLHGEPDLTVRVVRDIFNEDFAKLIVQGHDEWATIESYVAGVAPDLAPRLERWTSEKDVFAAHRIDEQLAKALDRKVWLPSGGYLIIDRTEAMIVVDVNTGKFVGKGGNLEETVTKNNLEAAEEIVRQLRLRDLGGIIVIDFVDMVLEGNRDLVQRRLTECLGRDRTKHQVAEVTSLGLVQMTRKRVGAGLLEVFSETCEHCHGRGVIVHTDPVMAKSNGAGSAGGNGQAPGGRKRRPAEPDAAAIADRAEKLAQVAKASKVATLAGGGAGESGAAAPADGAEAAAQADHGEPVDQAEAPCRGACQGALTEVRRDLPLPEGAGRRRKR